MFKEIKNILPKLLRAKRYALKFDIGRFCRFEKIKLIGKNRSDIRIGDKVEIAQRTEICGMPNFPTIIGDGTYINQECLICQNTVIGKNVAIGPRVSFLTDSHKIGLPENRAGKKIHPAIHVGDGCWIGGKSTILGGVTIGPGTVIGAGALVNKDCEPNALYAGVPAKFIKWLD